MESLRRFDERVARVESGLAVVVLLGMVFVASLQALFSNIAERNIAWAQSVVQSLSWVDAALQKGTLWIAFLGASLATHKVKHIAVDLLPRLASARVSAILRTVASLGAGVIAFTLARVFFEACVVADSAVPFDYVTITPAGSVHVCDAPPDLAANLHRPGVLCALRAGLAALHVPVSTGEGVAQLIAPIMFVVIGVRLIARALGLALALSRGETPAFHHAEKPTDPATIDTPAHAPSKPESERGAKSSELNGAAEDDEPKSDDDGPKGAG
ncbi:MAG TPA: TRAP transporter small permease subunit [Polyangiaceae bacterium]